MACGVPAPQGLLDPRQVAVLLDRGDVPHGLLEVPRLVRVEHDRRSDGVAAQSVGDDPQAPDVGIQIATALELSAGEASVTHRAVPGRELVVVEGDVEAGGVPADEAVARAEQPPQRLAGELGLQVPERRVERADAPERRARVPRLEHAREHAVVEGGHGSRVLALDRREEPVDVLVRPHADAFDALVGLEDDDRDLADARIGEPVHVSDGPAPVVERPQQR